MKMIWIKRYEDSALTFLSEEAPALPHASLYVDGNFSLVSAQTGTAEPAEPAKKWISLPKSLLQNINIDCQLNVVS